MPESLYKLAEQAAEKEHYGKFSDYVQAVIEADISRRKTTASHLNEEKPPIKYAVAGRSKVPAGKRSIAKEKEN